MGTVVGTRFRRHTPSAAAPERYCYITLLGMAWEDKEGPEEKL